MGLLDTAGRFIAHNPGTVAGIGAGLGAAGNLAREATKAGPEPKNYLGAGVRGAVAGGLAGGAVGGLGRAARDVQLLHPEISGAKDLAVGTAKHLGEGISNFAQRQLHGATGYGSGDAAYLDRIGVAGHGTAANKSKLLNLRADDALAHNPGKAESIANELHKNVSGVQQEGAVGQHFRDLGMTSVPGAVKSMATNPRESAKAIWNQLRAGGGAGVALGVGVPTAVAAGDIARGDERATGGRGVGEKVLRAGTSIGTGLMFGGVPVVPQMAAGMLADHAAGRLGRSARQPIASPSL